MNALNTNFKVGTKVKVYVPYGSFTYEDKVSAITPKGKYIIVDGTRYTAQTKNTARYLSRWGEGTIEII